MNKKIVALLASVVLLIFPVVTFSAGIVTCPGDPSCPVDGLTWFNKVIDNLLNIVIWPVFIGASLIMLIYAGFLFVTAAGDPSKISAAKKAVVFALIGITVGLLAFSVVSFIKRIVGV
jgi:hypothetical protein